MLNEKIKIAKKIVENRVVIQPMEGCDCNEDGSPSGLTVSKYMDFARSGAGIIWFEASAVCPEGRANFRQMRLTEENVGTFRSLIHKMREISIKENGFAPLMIIQLTHSGRQSIAPMIAYRNPVYEEKRTMTDDHIVTDEYLDSIPEKFVLSAKLAVEAGFDGVDVKSCHGYLMQELLSGFDREGRYGGSFENRSRCYVDCFEAVKKAVPADFMVVARVGLSDMVKKPYGFGTDEQGNLDLTEPKMLVQSLIDRGLELLNVTIGNPYYNPHINRPFRAGAYKAPETAEAGIKRFFDVEKEMKACFPLLKLVGSGFSYYRGNLMEKAEALLEAKVCDFAGFGRGALAYPQFYKDYLSGKFDAKKCCVACSKCSFLMRAHCVSGCAVFNEYYKNLYNENCVYKEKCV